PQIEMLNQFNSILKRKINTISFLTVTFWSTKRGLSDDEAVKENDKDVVRLVVIELFITLLFPNGGIF
ncbi:hypothetical protein PSY31_22900, partial [Shigella flexneri]|nr:hypothetical protein [Shigella flexneri]